MPKGNRGIRRKRTQEEYEKELQKAIQRFKKYPERLKAATDSEEWKEFLSNIGVNSDAANTKFFDDLRDSIVESETTKITKKGTIEKGYTPRQLAEAESNVEFYQRKSSKGKIYTQPVFRSHGRFVSRKTIEERLK